MPGKDIFKERLKTSQTALSTIHEICNAWVDRLNRDPSYRIDWHEFFSIVKICMTVEQEKLWDSNDCWNAEQFVEQVKKDSLFNARNDINTPQQIQIFDVDKYFNNSYRG